MCMCLRIYMDTMYVGTCRSQKKVSDLLGTGIVGGCELRNVGAGKEPWYSGGAVSALDQGVMSLAPYYDIFIEGI